MKRLAALAIAAVLVLGAAIGAAGEDLRVQRLAALGKLWADIKYFHPVLAYRELDWDRALVEALPRAAAAKTHEEYARAVESMLSVLNDPATRVIRDSASRPENASRPLLRFERDGILVITLNPDTEAAISGALLEELRRAASRVQSAPGVVFDLRRQSLWTDRDPSAVARWFITSGLNQRLTGPGLRIPSQRSRIHSGLSSTANGGSAYFHSAFYVRDGALLEGGPFSAPPSVFLVDPSSSLPPIAPALQSAGRAAVIAEKGASDASLVECHRVSLPGDITVQIRVSELLYEDGSTGLIPDLVLPGGSAGQPDDPPLAASLDLLRRGLPGRPPARPHAPPYAVPARESAYYEMANPPWEYRLLAGFRVWAAIQYFFAYRGLMEKDWAQALLEAIPRLEQAASPKEYALALSQMVAYTADSHAVLEGPPVREAFGDAYPPIRTRWIEGFPVVTAVWEPVGGQAAPEVGDVVLRVDGEEAGVFLKRLSRYFAASTPQSLNYILMQRWLAGPAGSVLNLTLRGAGGKVREVRLSRRLYSPRPWRTGDVMRVLPGNIGYVDLDRLAPQEVDEMFERFRNTTAIIFDMRGYPRGTGWLIAPRLTDRKQVAAARFWRPLAVAPAGRAGDVETLGAGWDFVQYLPESDQWKYKGRTVLLIDERAMSQAEHLGLFLEAANNTVFIGSRTAGADGDVARLVLPGGITLSFSGHAVRHADGRPLQRVGLVPHVEVHPTIRGIRAGRDEVLERALAWLGVDRAKVSGVGEAR